MKEGNHTVNEEQFSNEKPRFNFELDQSGYQAIYEDNFIHPTAIVSSSVKMGKGNFIGAYCIIKGNTQIGDNNEFVAYCSIGFEPEHKEYFGKQNKGLVIGNNNYFREFVTVNAGCEKPTAIMDNCIFLRGSHVGHDAVIQERCVLSCNVLIGGHSFLGKGVNMGLGAICHQYSKIGSYSMVGMGTIITKKSVINCFGKYIGNPARQIGTNDLQMEKFSMEEVNDIFTIFDNTKNG